MNASPSPVPVLLVGCGAVSRLFYVPALQELARHQVLQTVGVVDPVAGARASVGSALGAPAFADLASGLAAGAALAIIATPPKFHRAQAEAAFTAGLDVLCEKPLAATTADATAMVDAAAAANRLLAAGQYKRFFPAHRALKTLIERRTFGALQSVELAEGGRFGWPAATDSFFRREQTPGGVLLDIGVHVLDLLLWWLGEPTSFIYRDDALGGLEANCRFVGEFPGDVHVDLRLSRDWATPNCYMFRFERATIHCRVNASNRLELTLDDLPMTFAAELYDPLPAAPAAAGSPLETNPQSFIAQLVDVCAAVRGRTLPFVPGTEGVRAIRLIEACYARREPLEQPWTQPAPAGAPTNAPADTPGATP